MTIFLKKKIAVLTLIVAFFAGGGILATPHHVAFAQDNTNVQTNTIAEAPTSAGSSKNVVPSIVGWIVVALVWTLGQIMVVLMYLLLWVASYNDFINSPAVTNGWVILRDLCNMFFVLILLVIAFATVLNRENYAMKKLLPKFIIAAILINFSRLICGIIIDFSQVVMLTFVNGFRDIGGGNLANMLGISGYLSMSADSTQEISTLTIVGTYILALLYSIIATVVVATMLFVLVVRMVMIWIYVVLSPLPYLLSVLPATEKYASKWWDEFSKNVVSGPILAFFIWLSFASVQPDSTGASLINGATQPNAGTNEEQKLKGFEDSGAAPEAGISKSGSADNMLKFIISIGLLMGGLMITKELGGAVGSMAGAGFDKLKGAAKGVRNLATRPVTDRWQAFQGQREAARKEKIAAFGDRMYSRYNTAKTAVKTAPKAWAQSAALGVKGTLPLAAQQKINAIGAGITNAKNAITFKNWRQDRENRKSLKDGRIGAYQTGVYKDASGKYDILHENEHGEMVYARTKKDKKGKEILDAAGNKQYEFATDYRGENIGKMSEREYKVSNTWTKAMYKAKANSNQKEKKAIDDEQKKMADAGLSPSQLAAMLEDSATNKNQKMAASLTLAIKAGFKDHEQIAKAEESFGVANNALLSKQFNDDVDKKQAYIHYDINSEDEVKADKEMKKLQKRMIDKKLEVQDSAAYKNDRFIEAADNALTKDEFVRQMKQVSAHSLESDQALKIGHAKYLDRQTPVFDEDENFAKARIVVKDITKDGHDVVRGNNGQGIDAAKITETVKGMYDNMSYSDIAKQDIKTYDFNDQTVLKTPEQRAAYEEAHLQSLAALSEKKLQSIIDDKNGNRKTQRRLKELQARIFGVRGVNPPYTNRPTVNTASTQNNDQRETQVNQSPAQATQVNNPRYPTQGSGNDNTQDNEEEDDDEEVVDDDDSNA